MQSRKSSRKSQQPPQLENAFRVTRVLRFQSNAAAVTAITFANLLDLWNVATSAVTASRLCDRVRVRRVRIWAPPAATLVPVTCYLDWSGSSSGFVGPSSRFTDTSVGATRVAVIDCRPPRTSAASMWQIANASVAFTLSVPLNAVIDVELEMTVDDTAAGTAVSNAPAGATVGANYIRGLDGLAAAATVYPPLAYPTD
jgi:hypothetical protein